MTPGGRIRCGAQEAPLLSSACRYNAIATVEATMEASVEVCNRKYPLLCYCGISLHSGESVKLAAQYHRRLPSCNQHRWQSSIYQCITIYNASLNCTLGINTCASLAANEKSQQNVKQNIDCTIAMFSEIQSDNGVEKVSTAFTHSGNN